MPDLRLFDVMLFDYETTNRTDFRNGEIKPIVKTVSTEKSGCLRIRPPPLKDIHTLSDWKNPVSSGLLVKPKDIVRTNPKRIQEKYQSPKTVYKARPRHEKRSNTRAYTNTYSMTAWKGDMPPFNLYHKPKEMIRTNPSDVQQPFGEAEVELDEEVIKTRPRLVISPAVSIDDITDSSARNILISDMYMSSTTRALEEAVKSIKYNNVKAPLPGRPAAPNPIFLPRLQPPLVPPEWRMESVTRDMDQLRGYCNPTERFWLQRELPECKMCEETEAIRVHRNMLRDLKRGNR